MKLPAQPYNRDNRMRDLIADNSLLLKVISRFGILLGFGNHTVAEVCGKSNIDTGTFLCVANFISGKEHDASTVSLPALMDYLKRAHNYFLNFILPVIRRKLIGVIDCSGIDEVGFLVLRFYDEYVQEVRSHMEYENARVFGYVEGLLAGRASDDFSIDIYAGRHDAIATKLADLKDIIIRYYPGVNGNDMLNSALFDIINVEQDLVSHCEVEDKIFIPAVARLEEQVELHAVPPEKGDTYDKPEKLAILSEREKEIISLIARGLATKEIADTLCISVHTVTTHRRNISSKLGIHSASGLTIFAIINHLVDLDEIKLNS